MSLQKLSVRQLRQVYAVRVNSRRLRKKQPCFKCGTTENLTVHHQVRVGEVKDYPREKAVELLSNPENCFHKQFMVHRIIL